jgi:poly-beta-1,6-N-acetyl-D-glucosamine synthase
MGCTLRSLLGQTRLPHRIVVVADNCTDATVEIARGMAVEVIATVGNRDKSGDGVACAPPAHP